MNSFPFMFLGHTNPILVGRCVVIAATIAGSDIFSYIPESRSLKWKSVLRFLCKFVQLLGKDRRWKCGSATYLES